MLCQHARYLFIKTQRCIITSERNERRKKERKRVTEMRWNMKNNSGPPPSINAIFIYTHFVYTHTLWCILNFTKFLHIRQKIRIHINMYKHIKFHWFALFAIGTWFCSLFYSVLICEKKIEFFFPYRQI